MPFVLLEVLFGAAVSGLWQLLGFIILEALELSSSTVPETPVLSTYWSCFVMASIGDAATTFGRLLFIGPSPTRSLRASFNQDSLEDTVYAHHPLSTPILKRTAMLTLVEMSRNTMASGVGWFLGGSLLWGSNCIAWDLLYAVTAGSIAPLVVSGALTLALALLFLGVRLCRWLAYKLWLAGYW